LGKTTSINEKSVSELPTSEFDSFSQTPYQEALVIFCTDWLLFKSMMINTENLSSIFYVTVMTFVTLGSTKNNLLGLNQKECLSSKLGQFVLIQHFIYYWVY